MKTNNRLIIFTLVLVAITTFCKFKFALLLEWSGFSPIIAISLFSGMLINDRSKSFLLPLIAIFASDVIVHAAYLMGLYNLPGFYIGQVVNYALLVGVTLIGWALRGKNYGNIALGGIIAPTVFFVCSNFSSWVIDYGNLYTNDFTGLMNSYAAGLPFYKNALAATLIFLPSVLLGYNFLVRKTLTLRLA